MPHVIYLFFATCRTCSNIRLWSSIKLTSADLNICQGVYEALDLELISVLMNELSSLKTTLLPLISGYITEYLYAISHNYKLKDKDYLSN